MNWFDLYWGKKRFELNADGLKHQTPEKLAQFAKELEKQVAGFWKFRARNTLRIMQTHSKRRVRLLLAFGF